MTQENEHIRTLVAARNRELDEKYNRGHTEKWELFTSIQSTIEAIDRALADEGQLASGPGGRPGFRIGHQ
jgi:hypothetical protein